MDKYGGRRDIDTPDRSMTDSVDRKKQIRDVSNRRSKQQDRVNGERQHLHRSSPNHIMQDKKPFISHVVFRGASGDDSKASDQSLHPSWIAKKMLKEKAAKLDISLAAIKAKKIVFSEED